MPNRKLVNRFIKFLRTSHGVARNSMRRYSNKFSRHDFTQHQLMSLSCLRKRLRMRYREFIELLELIPKVMGELGLSKLPHFTTLQKFLKRVGTAMLDRLLCQTIKLFDIQNPWIAGDGTGHACSHASLYYAKKLKKHKKRRRKHYTKNSIAVDADKQVIVAHRVRKGPKHDSKDAAPILRKTKRLKPKGVSLDKAYDAEYIHKVIREELKAESQIPIRKNKALTGEYRQMMLTELDKKKYHRRSIVETVISVEKRVLGDANYSRSDRMRNKEGKLRNICYNIYRSTVVFISEILKDFYKADF